MKKLTFMIIMCILLIVFLTSCSGKPLPNDLPHSIIDRQTCTLPCWNNIVPGKTSKKELLDAISVLSYVDQSSIIEVKSSSKIYSEQIRFELKLYQKQENLITVEASIQKDIVIAIGFFGDLGISLGDVVLDTGEPENLLTMTLPGGYSTVIMLNRTKGLAFEYGTYDTDINIEKNSPITTLILFSSIYYEKLMDEGMFSAGLYKKDDTLRILYPWSGYGYVNKKYPPRNP